VDLEKIKFATFAKIILLGGLLLLGPLPLAAPVSAGEVDWHAVERDVRSVVASRAAACYAVETREHGWGSAVMIDPDGILISAAHLFRGIGEKVTLHQADHPPFLAEVTRIDRDHDIALIRATPPENRVAYPWIPFAEENRTGGEAVIKAISLGHAAGFRPGRTAPPRFGFAYAGGRGEILISTCRINCGDSGGALLALDETLIGIHRSIDRRSRMATHVTVSSILATWPDLVERKS